MSYTTNIQWKGTDLCMDFVCPEPGCEKQSHYDGMFAHVIQCPGCGTEWTLATDIPITRGNQQPQYWTAMQATSDLENSIFEDD